ncbi:hypothetical protein J3F84DRAFT_236463 [Trichoderma pleuroticola]
MVASLGKDSLPSSLEPGSGNAPIVGHCLHLVVLLGCYCALLATRKPIPRSLFCTRMPALLLTCSPSDRQVARPWYYWIPTEWLSRNVVRLAGDASLARPLQATGRVWPVSPLNKARYGVVPYQW